MKIAIASGKGGTGKTTVSTNLFLAIKEIENLKVDFLDCDVEEPNARIFLGGSFQEGKEVYSTVPVFDTDACAFCGRCVHFCEAHAILMVKEIEHIAVMEDLCTGCGACLYSCNYGAITEKKKSLGKVKEYEVNGSRFFEGEINIGTAFATPIIKKVKCEIDDDNITIIDAPPGTSCLVIQTVEGVDYVILVTEPTPFGLHDLRLMVDTLKITGHQYGVVINRAGLGYKEMYDYLEINNIDLLLEIPFDRKIAEKYAHGKPLIEGNEELKLSLQQLFHNVKAKVKQQGGEL